jgi:hypothetical protein
VDDPVVFIMAGGGSVLVDGFTVTNGNEGNGGGFNVRPSGNTEVTVSNNRIIGNTSSHPSLPGGAGVYFNQTSGNGQFYLVDNLISGNTVENTGGASAAGGCVMLYAHDASSFTATGNRIIDNTCVAPMGTVYGCGASIYHNSTGTSEFSDNLVKGNRTETANGDEVEGAGGSLAVSLNGNALTARRNLWIDNRDIGSQEGYHVKFSASGSGVLSASDSVVAGGTNVGVGAWNYDSSVLRLTNLTIFDHADLGVHYRGFGAESTLFNTIVFGSATLTDFNSTNVTTGGNLLGTDPLFVGPASWDCHLNPGSPALDAGDNAPPGGLGPSDLDGNPRVIDGVVDVGAFEGVAAFFWDGFESGTTSQWSATVP